MTRRAARPEHPAGPDGEVPSTRACPDCIPQINIQGGAWGWASHRFYLHDEGEPPGDCPQATQRDTPLPTPRWTDADRAAFHARNRAARLKQRRTPPPTGRGGPPRTGSG